MPIRPFHVLLIACALIASFGARSARALERFDFEERYFRDPVATVADHTLFKADSVYHLFYTRGLVGNPSALLQQSFGHATSTDLVHWTIHDTVIPPVPGTWENQAHWAPYVIERPAGVYNMYYTGIDSLAVQQIGLATSTDLFTWTPHPSNPVFHPDTSWAEWSPTAYSNCRDPFVWVDGDTLRMFVTAVTSYGRGAIGSAWSIDGVTWTDSGPVALTPSGPNSWHQLEACTMTNRSDTWHLYYGETNVVGIGMVPAPDQLGPWDLTQRTTVDYGSAIEIYTSASESLGSRHTAFIDRDTVRTTIRIDPLVWVNDTPTFAFSRTIDEDWTRTGTAMTTQPTFGDNVRSRNAGSAGIAGNGWIGTFEKFPGPLQGGIPGFTQGNGPTGSLVSRSFVITGDTLSVLVGGSNMPDSCYVQLCDACTDSVLRAETGQDAELMTRRVWPVAENRGQVAYLRIADNATGGHINVDDIVELPAAEGSAPALPPQITLLSPVAGDAVAIALPDTIRWSLRDAPPATTVSVYLSVDGGLTYPRLLGTVAEPESLFEWVVDEQPTTHARIRLLVRTTKDVTACDSNDGDVVISSVSIGNVRTTNVTDTTATIFWTTGVPSDGIVEFGKTLTPEFSFAQATGPSRVHTVVLHGLTPGQTYYYRVISQGEIHDNFGAMYSFTSAQNTVGSLYRVLGAVTNDEGTPLPGVAVLVTLRHEGVASFPLLGLSTGTGSWNVDLQKARDPATGLFLPAYAGDSLRIEMYASPLLLNVLDPVIVTGVTPQQIGSSALVTAVPETNAHANGAPLGVTRVWPMPARRAVSLALDVRGAQDVTVRVIDARGRAVRTLAPRPLASGPRVVVWDGNDDAGRPVPSGVYTALLSSARAVTHARVLIAR